MPDRDWFYPVLQICLVSCSLPVLAVAAAFGNEVICASPDGELIATAFEGGRIELRSTSVLDEVVMIQHEGVPSLDARSAVSWMPTFIFSPDGRVLASACGLLPVTLWDTKTGAKLRDLGSGGDGRRLLFSADGSRLLSYGLINKTGHQRLSLWDVNSGKQLRQLTVDHSIADKSWNRESFRPRFAKSGPMLGIEVIHGANRAILIWDTVSSEQKFAVKSFPDFPSDWIITPNGRHLLVREYTRNGEEVKRHRLFEMSSGKVIAEWGESNATEN